MTEALHTLIPLVNGDYAWIDVDDLPRVRQYRWYKKRSKDRKRWYVLTTNMPVSGAKGKEHLSLHRFINQTPAHLHTDHINGNGLDNTRRNLRSVTIAQNQWNQSNHSPRVTLRPYNRWEASIRVNKQSIYLGTFDTREQAERRYWEAATELRGSEFCRRENIQ